MLLIAKGCKHFFEPVIFTAVSTTGMQFIQIRRLVFDRFNTLVKYLAVIGIIGTICNIGHQIHFIVRLGCLCDTDALTSAMTVTLFAISSIYITRWLKCTVVEFFGRLHR